MRIIEKIKTLRNLNETVVFNIIIVIVVIILGISFYFYDKKQDALYANYMESAEKELDVNNIQGVITNFTEAIKIKPSHYKAYGGRAFTYYLSNQLDEALADSEKVLSLKGGEDESIYKLRGDIFREKDLADQALEAYSLAYSLASSTREHVHDYVNTLIYVEEYEKAYEIIKKYVDEAPKDDFWEYAEIWVDLGMSSLMTSRCLEAAASGYHAITRTEDGEWLNTMANSIMGSALNRKDCIDTGEDGEASYQEVKDAVAKNEALIFFEPIQD